MPVSKNESKLTLTNILTNISFAVLLALLEFDERCSVATEDVTKCTGLVVLKMTAQNSPVACAFAATEFCRALAEEMKNKGCNFIFFWRRDRNYPEGGCQCWRWGWWIHPHN